LADLETLEAATALFAERLEDDELWTSLDELLPLPEGTEDED